MITVTLSITTFQTINLTGSNRSKTLLVLLLRLLNPHISLLFSDLSTGALEYRCTTRKLPLCNGTIIVLKITLLHSVSVSRTSSFQSVTDRQTKKHHTCSSTAGARPTIPTILGMVIEEVRPVFAPPEHF